MYVECEWCGKMFYRRKSDKRYTGIYCSQDCITARDQSNYKVKFLRENKVFRIVHYESKENVIFACRTCGEQYTADSTSAMKRRTCPNCRRIKAQKEKELEEKRRELKALQKRLEELETKIERGWKAAQRREGHKETVRAARKRIELRRGNRIKVNGEIDKDISLKRLFRRDKGICHICGKPCDYEDYTRSDKGAFIVGKLYPSIDHVKPLSHGGTHTWDNVRLAHMICNAYKGNKIPALNPDF